MSWRVARRHRDARDDEVNQGLRQEHKRVGEQSSRRSEPALHRIRKAMGLREIPAPNGIGCETDPRP